MDRPLIKDMTSQELYALDFAKMSASDRAEFRDELTEKPGHGPLATPREHRIYAEAHARWSDWIKDHPEDDVAETKQLAAPQPRPDGTTPLRPPKETGL
jgi:hypothetical protein